MNVFQLLNSKYMSETSKTFFWKFILERIRHPRFPFLFVFYEMHPFNDRKQ